MKLPPPSFPFPEQVEELQKQLGKALLRFQHVETGMFQIAHCLMGTTYEISSLVFFHSKSAENKLALLQRLIDHKLKQHTRTAHWKPLLGEINDAIQFRNAISHFEIIMVDGKQMVPPSNYDYAISDHHHDGFARRSGNIRGLSVESIEEHSEKTRALALKLVYFIFDHVPGAAAAVATFPEDTRRHLAELKITPRPPIR